MPEANKAALRVIESAAPSGPLANELEQVVASAQELRRALKGINVRSDEFPHDALDDVAARLEVIHGLTRDGALEALQYAISKLAQLRLRAVPATSNGKADEPGIARGGAVDNALARLMADVGAAHACYKETDQARAEQSPVSERLVATGDPATLKALAKKAGETARQSGQIASDLAGAAVPGAIRADNLVRGVRDVESLKDFERIELDSHQPRMRHLDLLERGIERAVPYVKIALRAVEVGADIGKIVFEQAHRILIGVWFDAIKDGGKQIRKLIEDAEQDRAVAGIGGRERPLRSLDVFRDHLKDATPGPNMIVIPAGSFMMGSPDSDNEAKDDEKPQRHMPIPEAFALARGPVTFEEYDRFCMVANRELPSDHGWGRGRRPVIEVTWQDARDFCDWLSRETGGTYRLPTEAEWEFACRAGTRTRRWWGNEWNEEKANGANKVGKTTEVGDYPPNPWGLLDMLGNVFEWCEDLYVEDLGKLPNNGAAYTPKEIDGPNRRILRGGSWNHRPSMLRSADRDKTEIKYHRQYIGFRVAKTILLPAR